MESLLCRARRTRWINVGVANLRLLIGFAFVPAGLKKLLDQPFTDPAFSGPFHDFLDAFHATGWFYQFVGAMQLITAVLLCTQRYAAIGALLGLPILTAITAFCWSTEVYPTATVATLMWLGTVALVLWDYPKWRGLLGAGSRVPPIEPEDAPIDLRLWALCGVAVLALYLGVCIAMGEIYRPKGATFRDPGFYVFPAILLMPIATFVIDQRRLTRGRAPSRPA